ncbi:MAG: TIGR03086 family metal-binding protein [Dehalococcoidia bacterium]
MTQEILANPVALFEKATKHVSRVVAGVQQEQLDHPTPCSEWNVQELLNHLIGGAEMVVGCFSGQSPDIAPGSSDSSYSTETQASGLAQAYQAVVSQALQAAREPGALERNIETPIGEMPCAVFLSISSMDQFIHGWDLAKATGQDTALDPELAQVCYGMCVPDMADQGREAGVIGPVVAVPDDASTQDKLLGYMGRQP